MPIVTPDLHDVGEALARAADIIAVPRAGAATSFVLHAPLELLARAGLLRHVAAGACEAALARIGSLADAYACAAPPVGDPPPLDVGSTADATGVLERAVRTGDAALADAAFSWLAARAGHREVRHAVAPVIVDSLAAAGHAPIGLHLLPRVVGGALPATLLRGSIRGVAAEPTWRITWPVGSALHDLDVDPPSTTSMQDAVAAVPYLGCPGSDFIQPLMSQVQDRGLMTRLFRPAIAGDVDIVASGRALLRAAAWSMLHDDPQQAPYGWTHCLTMPQAVLSLAGDGVDERTALAVAATFVAGFRAAHGREALVPVADHAGAPIDARSVPDVVDLATSASLHHDAHLVKYTLACIHAAAADPAWGGTYLAAAAHLIEWWSQQPQAD